MARMGKMRNAYRILTWKPLGKQPLGNLRRKWDDDDDMELREVWCEEGRWMEVGPDCVKR
jgi:hypothetical protein